MSKPFRDPKPLLPKIPKMGKRPRPLMPERHTFRPRGPMWAWRAMNWRMEGQGPGEPPPGFVTAHTSASEWRYYWAIAKVMGDPRDPRKGPYTGGRNWVYQAAADGVFTRSVASQVIDFVVDLNGTRIGLRIQTERWHVMASSKVIERDKFLKTHTKGVDVMIDLFDQWSIGDPTGKAVIDQVIKALRLTPDPDPITNGTALRVRAPRWG